MIELPIAAVPHATLVTSLCGTRIIILMPTRKAMAMGFMLPPMLRAEHHRLGRRSIPVAAAIQIPSIGWGFRAQELSIASIQATDVWKYSGGTGGTWTKILTKSAGGTPQAMAIDPTNANHLIVVTTVGKLDESTNAGGEWSGLSDSPSMNGGATPWQGNLAQPYPVFAVYDQVKSDKIILTGDNGIYTTTFTSGSVSGAAITWTRR